MGLLQRLHMLCRVYSNSIHRFRGCCTATHLLHTTQRAGILAAARHHNAVRRDYKAARQLPLICISKAYSTWHIHLCFRHLVAMCVYLSLPFAVDCAAVLRCALGCISKRR